MVARLQFALMNFVWRLLSNHSCFVFYKGTMLMLQYIVLQYSTVVVEGDNSIGKN